MVMRIRHHTLGGHVHCRVFTAPERHMTDAKCGDLVFRVEEWAAVVALLSAVEFVPEVADHLRGGRGKPTDEKVAQ